MARLLKKRGLGAQYRNTGQKRDGKISLQGVIRAKADPPAIAGGSLSSQASGATVYLMNIGAGGGYGAVIVAFHQYVWGFPGHVSLP